MGSPRQDYCIGLPFPSPGDLSNPGIEPRSPALASEFSTTEPPGKSPSCHHHKKPGGGDLPGGPVVENLPCSVGKGLTPGWGTKVAYDTEQLNLRTTQLNPRATTRVFVPQ